MVAVALALSAAIVMLGTSRAAFVDTTDNPGSYFEARACFLGSTTYDFSGVTSPSSSHTAEDGEIDQLDPVVENGTFATRRDTIGGWALWSEATSGEYSNLVGSDNLYYQGVDPEAGDNAAMIFEFDTDEKASCVTQIDVDVEAAQSGVPGTDLLFVYLWNYQTSSYLVGGSMNGTTDQTVSFSVTNNAADYINDSDGQVTVFVVNEDTSDWIRIDDITLTISVGPAASVSGTLTPSHTEAAVVAGTETLVITLINDTWDPTVGANNSITTDLINGIDSAQSETNGWDAVVKTNLDFNDVTRTSNTVVTITLGAEPTYDITADETITVIVPATAVASGGPITAIPTFDIIAGQGCVVGSTTYDFTGINSPSSSHIAEDGEIAQADTVIENGTFAARQGPGIVGWALWGEATSGEYSNLVGSDNLYYQGADPGGGDNAAMIFEFDTSETEPCVTQIDVDVEAAQGGAPGADLLFVYLWNYQTSSYLVGGSMNGTTDQTVSFSVTNNAADYINDSDGQVTVFVVNEDTNDWIRIDDITLTITTDAPAPTAALSGSVVPWAGEGGIAGGGETLEIKLTNDTWDATVGANNSITTDLINGIDSAQAEANGWDAIVKTNLDFNDVTRTSNTVVTITLGAEPTYDITADETITVTVPATAVTSSGPITATPTFTVGASNVKILDLWTTGTTHTVSAGSNRLLLVAVYGEDSGAISSVDTVTWGGQTLTGIDQSIVGTGYSNLVWLGYLDEAGITAASGNTIIATWQGSPPSSTTTYSAITLENVDQVTPIAGSSTGTALNASTVQPTGALAVDPDDLAVYITVSGIIANHTAATGYTEGTEEQIFPPNGHTSATAHNPITATGSEQPIADWGVSNSRLAIISTIINPN